MHDSMNVRARCEVVVGEQRLKVEAVQADLDRLARALADVTERIETIRVATGARILLRKLAR